MASTTTSDVELAKIRCRIHECKTFEVPEAYGSDLTIGTFYVCGDTLAMALNEVDVSADSEIAVMAYEIPAVVVPCRGAAIAVGAGLGYVLTSHIFAENDSDLTVLATAIETKASGPSEILVHFDGRGKAIFKGSTSLLEVSLDTAV